MGKTYRRQSGDKFERRQRKRQRNPKKINGFICDSEKDFKNYSKDDSEYYK